ncbi:hypothetical protein [Staphylococcus capitis]|uniref:hypothetical protein n=1 Tax=Staphylococcus capitis TaxID=29388 RepID=UPI001642C5BE|nr:hypothetical protein [Staphylococcus capitis]
MNEINEVSGVFREVKDECEGKVVEDKGGLCKLNGCRCNDEIRSLSKIIEGLSGEK